MANTLAAIPKVFTRGLGPLREAAVMAALVTNFSYLVGSAAQRGDVLTIPKSASQTGAAITAAATAPANSDHAQTSETLTIGTHWGTRFHLTDQELTQIDADEHFIPGQMEEAFKVLGNKVDTDLMDQADNLYGGAGTAGTTPFASAATDWVGSSGAQKILNDQLSNGPYNIVLDPAAYGNAMNLANIVQAQQRGSDITAQTGRIGHALGADWYMSQNVATHTTGTLSDGTDMSCLVNNASVAIGDTTVPTDETSLTGTVVAGDRFTVAGDTQQYVITTGATAASNAVTLTFTPGAKVAWADDAQIEFIGLGTNPVRNLAFNRGCFGVAFATPKDVSIVDAGPTLIMTDPVTGIPVRLKVREGHYQTTWYLDILFGVSTVWREKGAIIMG